MAEGRSERRIKRFDLVGAIFSDPFRKLAAIGLAILLWHYLDSMVTTGAVHHMQIVESDTAHQISTHLTDELQVRIGKRSYSILRCRDGRSGEEIRGVTLTLEGPKHLIETIDENPGYYVIPHLGRGRADVAEIEVDDIRAINSEYQRLIRSMAPSSVIVELDRNEERLVSVIPENIRVKAPDNVPEFVDRLVWDEADFTSDTVMLFGPKTEVSKIMGQARLFSFEPQAPVPGSNSVRGDVMLIDDSKKIRMDPESIHVSVPLRRPSALFELVDVPVILAGTEEVRNRYRPREPYLSVSIRAMNNLEGFLANMDEDQRRDWARRDTILVAPLREDDVGPVIRPIFLVLDPTFAVGRDYKTTSLPPVSIVSQD